ncbi:hypothetical protein GN956_G14086 [Arapaima gigas]
MQRRDTGCGGFIIICTLWGLCFPRIQFGSPILLRSGYRVRACCPHQKMTAPHKRVLMRLKLQDSHHSMQYKQSINRFLFVCFWLIWLLFGRRYAFQANW